MCVCGHWGLEVLIHTPTALGASWALGLGVGRGTPRTTKIYIPRPRAVGIILNIVASWAMFRTQNVSMWAAFRLPLAESPKNKTRITKGARGVADARTGAGPPHLAEVQSSGEGEEPFRSCRYRNSGFHFKPFVIVGRFCGLRDCFGHEGRLQTHG
jgi:hypothetical protein